VNEISVIRRFSAVMTQSSAIDNGGTGGKENHRQMSGNPIDKCGVLSIHISRAARAYNPAVQTSRQNRRPLQATATRFEQAFRGKPSAAVHFIPKMKRQHAKGYALRFGARGLPISHITPKEDVEKA